MKEHFKKTSISPNKMNQKPGITTSLGLHYTEEEVHKMAMEKAMEILGTIEYQGKQHSQNKQNNE